MSILSSNLTYSSASRDAYLQLLARVGDHLGSLAAGPSHAAGSSGTLLGPSTSRSVPLDRTKCPKIKFWYKHEYRAYCKANKTVTDPTADQKIIRGSTRAAQGINVTMKYVEDDEGNPVDGYRATTMRHHAQAIFARLHELGLAPETWGAACTDAKKAYIEEMEQAFEELTRCADHWKVMMIATAIYPSWYRNHVLNLEGPAVEVADDDDSDNDDGEPEDGNDHGNTAQDHQTPTTQLNLKKRTRRGRGPIRKRSRTARATSVVSVRLFTRSRHRVMHKLMS